MPRPIASLLCCLWVASLLSAQTRMLHGLVRGIDGRPWAGATVVLRHLEPLGGGERMLLEADHLGRFSGELEPLHPYEIFAHTPPEDGQYRVTQRETVVAGERVSLREVERKRVLRVQIEGLDAWRGKGLQFSSWGPCSPDADGWLTIPPNPRSFDYVDVHDADGLLLCSFEAFTPDAEGRCRVQLPPPSKVTLRIQDEDGRPVRDAVLRPANRPGGVPPEASRPNDELELEVPLFEEGKGKRVLRGLSFGVQAPGFVELDHVAFDNVGTQKDGEREVLDVELAPGQRWRGRVLLTEGRPLAGASVLQVTTSMYCRNGNGVGISGGARRCLSTGQDGGFETSASDHRAPTQLVLRADERLRDQLPESEEYPLYPLVLLATLPAVEQPDCTDLGELRLDALHALDLEVRRLNGMPARFAHVVLREKHGPDQPLSMRTNEQGRLRILVHASERVDLGARSDFETGFISAMFTGPKQLVLTLEPRSCLEGVVQDAAGKPLPCVAVARLDSGSLRGQMLGMQLGGRAAWTDGLGRFRLLAGKPGETCLLVLRKGVPGQPGFLTRSESVLGEDGPVRDLVFTLTSEKAK